MKVPYSWLKDLVPGLPDDVHKVANAIEMQGVELDGIHLGTELDPKIIVGEVKKVHPHPNADRLQLAEVNIKSGVVTVVCGAPNIEVGQKVAVCLDGATLPDGHRIGATNIRGVVSHGMVASPKELGWSADHSGILVLPEDSKVGESVSSVLGYADPVIETKGYANRPDSYSVTGIARETSVALNKKLVHPKIIKKTEQKSSSKLKVEIEESSDCGRYVAQIANVRVSESPKWLRNRLTLAGVRPINNVVDITNYVMLETGQPLHAFDYAKLAGAKIHIRRAGSGEKIETLDGKTRRLDHTMLVIADSDKPIAIAGVMGGAHSEVSDKTSTIVLESANFNKTLVRRTAQKLGVRTEASNRFEKGLPVQWADSAIDRAAYLLKEYAQATLYPKQDNLLVWPWTQHIGLRYSRIERLIGKNVPKKDVLNILRHLGFDVEEGNLVQIAKQFLGRPYVWGASFKKNGDDAFDCSYLVDRLYSRIGIWAGFTTIAQYDTGRPVDMSELRPGDVLFYEGIDKKTKREFSLEEVQSENSSKQPVSMAGSYFKKDESGNYVKVKSKYQGLVGHNGIYIGNNQVIHASKYEFSDGDWKQLPKDQQSVKTSPLSSFTENPGFLGARRFVEDLDDYIAVTAPDFRPDVRSEVDLIEEVARVYGFDKIPATLPPLKLARVDHSPERQLVRKLKNLFRAAGLFEVNTYSFISADSIKKYKDDPKDYLKLSNPMSSEQEFVRSQLTPSMLEVIRKNQNYDETFGVFEFANVFKPKGKGKLPDEKLHLAVAVYGPEAFLRLKGVVELMSRELVTETKFKRVKKQRFHPGRTVALASGGKELVLGEVHPEILANFEIAQRVAVLEVDLSSLLALSGSKQSRELPKFPAVKRDISFWTTADFDSATIIEPVLEQSDLIESAKIIDRYEQKETGQVSLALRVTLRAKDRTLSDEEANKVADKIAGLLSKSFGATIRT